MLGQLALRNAGLILVEMLLLIHAALIAATIGFGRILNIGTEQNGILLNLVLAAITFQVILYVLDPYQFAKTRALSEFARRLGPAMLLALIVGWILHYQFPARGQPAGFGICSRCGSFSASTKEVGASKMRQCFEAVWGCYPSVRRLHYMDCGLLCRRMQWIAWPNRVFSNCDTNNHRRSLKCENELH